LKKYQENYNKPLGFDEVIIVNPRTAYRQSASGEQSGLKEIERPLFLGEDGTLYALYGADDPLQAGDLLLGEDGQFYRVPSPARAIPLESDSSPNPGLAGSPWIG
jgi:hypothetical protein